MKLINNKKMEKYGRKKILKMVMIWGLITVLLSALGITGIVFTYKGIIDLLAVDIASVLSLVLAFLTGSVALDKYDYISRMDEFTLKRQIDDEYENTQEIQREKTDVPIYMMYSLDDIDKFKGKEGEVEYFQMDKSDFYDFEEFNIEGIDLDEIDRYILEHKIDLIELGKLISLSREEEMLLYLEYAKRYFMQGDITMGDRFLNEVDRCMDKSDYVMYVIEEIKARRKFYQYQCDTKGRTLSLEKRFRSKALINGVKN